MRARLTASVLAGLCLASCTAIVDQFSFGEADAGVSDAGTTDAAIPDSGPADDAGRDAGDDAGFDAGLDAGPVDACVGEPEICDGEDNDCDGDVDEGLALLACRIDEDNDGFSPPDSDVVMACACPEGRNATPEDEFDCGDTTPDAYPGQTEYFATRFPRRMGGITTNSFDYDCDGTEELRPLVSGGCRIGLAGTCPAEVGPWMYDAATTQCDHLVEWARCETDCSSTPTGMTQVGCH